MTTHEHTDAFRGAAFTACDLSGAVFRDCDLAGAKIVGSHVTWLRVSGGGSPVVVDGVDVTDFVAAELDRRQPERVALREARTVEDLQAVWLTVERAWDDTIRRVARLPEARQQERVEGEWSALETLRHLVFVVDCWAGRMLLGLDDAHHPLGLAPTDHPEHASRELGLDVDARPRFSDVVVALAERRGQVTGVFATLEDAGLAQEVTGAPAPFWGEETHTVEQCLRTLLEEFLAHHRYAERDLAVLQGD